MSCSVLLTRKLFVSPSNSSLMSPESETSSNTIVLIGYGPHAQLARLEEMKISKFPFLFSHSLVRVPHGTRNMRLLLSSCCQQLLICVPRILRLPQSYRTTCLSSIFQPLNVHYMLRVSVASYLIRKLNVLEHRVPHLILRAFCVASSIRSFTTHRFQKIHQVVETVHLPQLVLGYLHLL